MMYSLVKTGGLDELCLLRIEMGVLDLPGVVVSDCNAASGYARYFDSETGLGHIDQEELFSRYWTNSDYTLQARHKSRMCAEVLVPGRIEPSFVFGAYVGSTTARESLGRIAPSLKVVIDPAKFFR